MTSAPAAARRVPQDWHVLLGIYFVTQIIESYGVSQVFAFMPLYLQQLGLPASEIPRWVGLLGASVFLLGLPLVPLWGVWADKYSRKAVIIRSALVEVAVFSGVALAQTPWQFAIAILLVGLQLGNTGVMLAAIRDVTPRARLGFAVGLFGAASGIGYALGPIVGGIIVDVLGLPLQAIYWSSALLTFGIVLLLVFGSREVRPEHVPSGPVLRLAFGAVRGVFTDQATVRLFAIFGVALLATQMARPYIPILVIDLEGTGAGAATGIAIVIGGAALIGALISPVAGAIGDRVGFRSVLGVALAVAAVVVALLPLAPGVASLAAGNAVLAGCQAATSAMIFGLLAIEVPSERRSATLNLVYLPLYLAGIVGPAVGAVVAGVGVGAVFALAAAILAAGALAVAAGLRRGEASTRATAGFASVPAHLQSSASVDAAVRELEAENPAELR